MVLLIAICVAITVFTAIALVLVIATADKSPTATRLAELRHNRIYPTWMLHPPTQAEFREH